MNSNLFIEELNKLGILLNNEKIQKLNKYYELLVEENKKINLTAITKKEDVYLKHFYDSLTLIKAYDLNKNILLCDVGTGAGFPGLVLKICFPNLNITLIDALDKRIKFLNYVIKELNLENITCIHSRIEDYSRKNPDKFDIVTCRAVAKLNILNELVLPMVKIDGYFIPMKANIEEELKSAENSLKKLNSKVEEIITFKMPIEESTRNIIKIRKVAKIDKIYPRQFNKISKNPL